MDDEIKQYKESLTTNYTGMTVELLNEIKGLESEDKEDVIISSNDDLKIKLENMKMNELRVIGHKLNVYDTKKSELISEILDSGYKGD